MHNTKHYIQILFLLGAIVFTLLITSCNPTKTLSNEQFLVNNNHIKTKIKSLDKDEVNAIIKQKPNKKLFGFIRFYLIAYNYSKLGKSNKFKRWVGNTIAEEPVILDTMLTNRTVKQLKLFLQKKGYFDAVVSDSIFYVKQKANITFTLIGNKPYYFKDIEYSINDNLIRSIVISDTTYSLIKKNRLFNQNQIEMERDRLANLIRNNGYFNFNKEYIKVIADSALNKNFIKTQIVISNPTLQSDSVHHKYNIGKVTIFPDFVNADRTKVYTDTLNDKNSYTLVYNNKLKFKKEVLLRPIFFEPKKLFSQQDIEDTYKRYQSLRVFSNVNLDFKESSDTSSRTIDAYVRLTPLRKQSYSFEGEGTNSSGYFGIRGNIVYQNKNIFKGAEIFQAKTGLELKQLPNIITSSNQNTTEKIKNVTFNTIEIGPELSLTIPQFYFPFVKPFFSKKAYPKTIFTVAYNYQQNNNYTRNISNASFAYNWHEGKYKQHTITPIDFNIIGVIKSDTFNNILEARNNPLLTQSYQNLLITAFKYSFTYNNQETYKKAHTIYLRLNAETSGNIPQLINSSRGAEKVLNDDKTSYSYRIFRGIPSLSALEQPYAQYAKIEIDYRNYFNFAENKNLVVRFDLGYAIAYDNSKSLPFVKSFIGGGTNDIRAWRARTLGPGVYNNSQATVIEKIGDIKFVSNIEYRYKVFKKLNAATFIDMGNIWLVKDSVKTGKAGAQLTANNFTNAMAIGGGFGLRYDFTFFIFRLDIAAKLRDPARLEGERWVVLHKEFFNIGNFNFLNIGIGYPF